MNTASLGRTAGVILVFALLPAVSLAQGPGVQAYVAGNSGGWSKTEASTAEGGAPVRFEFGSGAGAGVRLSYGLTAAIGLWGAGELNVEAEGPFAGLFGGVGAAVPLGPRLQLRGRLGAGRLDDGPFGIGGATAEWLIGRRLGLGAGVEVLRPIGTGSRNNGLQEVDVEYDGGPTRLTLELGWYPGR